MANRKATFAKRQRETDLKERAKQKEDRRTQKRGEVRGSKGPQIAWDEAVRAVTSDDELPSVGGPSGNDDRADVQDSDAAEQPSRPAYASDSGAPNPRAAAPSSPSSGTDAGRPGAPTGVAAPRRVG